MTDETHGEGNICSEILLCNPAALYDKRLMD